MMIFLVVGLTVATYGLVRFGYGRPTSGTLPPCAGQVSPFRPKPQFAGRYVGVATRYPYQSWEHNFAEALTRPPGIVEYYEPFPNPSGFQGNVACFFAGKRMLSLIQLDPGPHVSLAAIAAGRYDGYLESYARAVKSFGARIALSFGHEMNGWWYSWGLHGNSPAALFTTKPGRFVAAWRHMHDVFAKAGATNVSWVWTVRQSVGRYDHKAFPGVRAWWPGSKYVDWIGVDGYFRRPTETFGSVFGTQITGIRAFTSKPILISETAVRMSNPDAAAQITGLFTGVRVTPGMLGVIWFDLDAKKTGIQWNIDRNKAALSAIRAAIHAAGPPAAQSPTPRRTPSAPDGAAR